MKLCVCLSLVSSTIALEDSPKTAFDLNKLNCFCSTRKWSDGIRRNAKWTEPGVNYEWETYFIGFHALLSSSTMPIHFSTNKDIIIFPFFSFELGDDANLGDLSCNSLLPPRLFTGPLVLFSASTAWRMFRQQSWTHPDKFYKCISLKLTRNAKVLTLLKIRDAAFGALRMAAAAISGLAKMISIFFTSALCCWLTLSLLQFFDEVFVSSGRFLSDSFIIIIFIAAALIITIGINQQCNGGEICEARGLVSGTGEVHRLDPAFGFCWGCLLFSYHFSIEYTVLWKLLR